MAPRKRFATGAFLLGLAVTMALGAGPAMAASGGTCLVSGGVSLSDPLTLTPSTGTYSFTADTTLQCVGVLGGSTVVPALPAAQVTSPGHYGDGILSGLQGGDTCAQGSGGGTFNANVPKLGGGALNVTGAYDFVRLGTLVLIEGTATANNQTGQLVGVFQFTPDLGQTCATTAVTHANVTGQAFVAGP